MKDNDALLDLLLENAESTAERAKTTLTWLNPQIIHERPFRFNPEEITQELNRLYLEETSGLADKLHDLQIVSLPGNNW
jgi:hypothetical protein